MSLQPVEVRQPGDWESAWAAIRTARSDALVTLADTLVHAHRQQVVEFAMRARLPAIYPEREYADAGGLMASGPSLRDLYRRAAIHVDKVLKGANPGDLPIEQATTFELVINLKTAKALGLTIPPSLLLRADQVIE
jgi:putative ABC transport system substrate-binding protein